VTPQTITGEKGINLIERRCLEMGYLFHPRRVDHGIDGHIDLVDPGSRALLNQVLLVQSKASDHPFPGETDQSFRYVCDDRDLDLWLSGNAPVILVLSHPGQDEAWWVEVKSAFPDAASRASRTVVISKHAQRFDVGAAPALLRLAVPKQSGLYLRPPPITESLTTNLMPVAAMPSVIYVATSAVSSYCFTSDGYTESRFADSLLAGIKRLDRHPAVLGWTRMWANHLTRPLDLFTPERPVTFGTLATVTVGRGIDDNWWGPAPAEAVPEEDQEHSPAAEALAVTELAAADIDTDDLVDLLTGPGDEPGHRAAGQTPASRHPRRRAREGGKKGGDDRDAR
jgi:Domain of unknown function (DUF4365)